MKICTYVHPEFQISAMAAEIMDSGLYYNQNVTISPTILPDKSPCGQGDIELMYYSLITSVCIIICLSFLEKRSNERCRCTGQRPGLVYPVNLLDHGCDNFGYSMAFGSVASYCFTLFFDLYSTGPPWSKTLVAMLSVLLIGLMFYPLFACLTTTWVFVGSLLGLGYSALWLYITIRSSVIVCPNESDENVLQAAAISRHIPVLFCLMCLFLRYGYILIKHSIHFARERSMELFLRQEEREHLGTKYNREYVQELLKPACRSSDRDNFVPTEEISCFKRLRIYLKRYTYQNDPTFKYSPRIICIFTVALICAYQIGVLIIFAVYQIRHKVIPHLHPNFNTTTAVAEFDLFLQVFDGSVIFSFSVSSLFSIFSIFQILIHYRQSIKRMYRGEFKHLPFRRDRKHPHFILSDSLSYAGTQIAHTLLGYVIVLVVLTITCLLLMYLIVLPAFGLIPREILHFFWNILPGFVILQVLKVLQKVFCRPLLQRRTSVNEKGNASSAVVLALNNRKVYHIVCYFLFFFYIVLGVFQGLLKIFIGTMLEILHLARLDKSGLLAGFETWDKGYMYYVSFLYVEECHRHPVLLVFCDILVDGLDNKRSYKLHNYGSTDDAPLIASVNASGEFYQGTVNGINNGQTHIYAFDKPRRLVRNRWLKAYTMIKNPGLKDID